MVWRRPILFLPSCKDFYMYYNQRAWMTPPYNKQLIEGHTSWGLWTYLNSSCCNTLSISYSANNVLRGGDGERAQTFIVLVSLEKQYRSTSHKKERKKNAEELSWNPVQCWVIEFAVSEEFDDCRLVGIVRGLMNNKGIFATALIINSGMPPANHTFCLIANYQLLLNHYNWLMEKSKYWQ